MSALTCKVLVTQQLTWKQRIRLWWLSQVQSWRALIMGTCVSTKEVPVSELEQQNGRTTAEGPFFYIDGGDRWH